MFFLILIIIFALLIVIFGGRISNLTKIEFKVPWLVLIAIALKIISISTFVELSPYYSSVIPIVRVISLLMVIVFLLINLKIKGVPIIGIGMLSNALVIIANKGNMPVNSKYVSLIASGKEREILEVGGSVASFVLTSSNTKLSFLGDIFLMPQSIPMTRLYSIGDVIITIGAITFLVYYLKTKN